jgi:hypothetical protein
VRTLRRPAADALVPIVTITLALLVAACGAAAPASSQPVASRASPAPVLTTVPGGHASPVVGASIAPPTTTETEFGTIFDSLPPSFPRLPGQEPVETGAGATSGSFAVNMSVSDARKIIEVSLIDLGWTVVVGSPLEDGSVVLEASRAPSGCKAEVRFTPASGTVIMSVLYGAACPFN